MKSFKLRYKLDPIQKVQSNYFNKTTLYLISNFTITRDSCMLHIRSPRFNPVMYQNITMFTQHRLRNWELLLLTISDFEL